MYNKARHTQLFRVTRGQARNVSWVTPVLVAEVEFSNWTDQGLLRHPSFQGLREDKPASKVIHDEPLALTEVKAMANGHKAATAHQNRKRESSPIQRCVIRPAVYGAADDEFAGVRLSHPDKVLYPDQGLTKRDLAKYYAQVADWMLPHVIIAAREVRLLLEELGLTSFLKTTGGKGLHLVVPIQPRAEWDEAKAFCRAVADFVVRAAPDRFIATMSKAARTGKIFIDYLRNGRGSSAVAPYSTRAKPGATVSAPIAWEELTSSLHSDHDRKPAGPPEQAREGPVGRRAADKTIDHRRDGEAP